MLAASRGFAQTPQPKPPTTLIPVLTRDTKVVHRWSLAGDPRGVAVGPDGTIYVGLAQPQAVVAIDPKTATIKNQLVLDSVDIASTKELVTLRINRDGSRLYVANGSDESATILSLPNLGVVREITMEGEAIRDAVPDPRGRYLYLLGRRIHVYDINGENELKTLPFENPTAMAVASGGNAVAAFGSENFGNAAATVVALYETESFKEVARDPMQTDKRIEAALFAANDRAVVAISTDALFEKPLNATAPKTMASSSKGGPMRMTLDFGDLVNSERICTPARFGPQIATVGATSDLILFAERRCSVSGTIFSGSDRRITPQSLYGVDAYAVAFDAKTATLVVTERAGFVTIYKVPKRS